MKRTQF